MFDEKSYSLKMDKTIEVFSKELSSLRTGRANASMLDLIKVDVYGQQMPINQVGSITTPEPRMINIQIWDANNVSLVDAAIKKSDLGLNPQIDGQLIRLPVPELNEERRTELKKLIKSIGEMIRDVKNDGLIMFDIQNCNHPIHIKYMKEQLKKRKYHLLQIFIKLIKNIIKLLLRPIKVLPMDWSFKRHLIVESPSNPSLINLYLSKNNISYKICGVNWDDSSNILEEINTPKDFDRFHRLVYKIKK